MRELSLNEIGMVSGGVHDDKGGGGGRFGVATSMAVGSASSTGGYVGGKVATNQNVEKDELVLSAALGAMMGFFGGSINFGKQAVNIIGTNTVSGALQAGYHNQKSGNNKVDKAGLSYQDDGKR